jgi:hypothetical protein
VESGGFWPGCRGRFGNHHYRHDGTNNHTSAGLHHHSRTGSDHKSTDIRNDPKPHYNEEANVNVATQTCAGIWNFATSMII